MEGFITKQEGKLYKALNKLISDSVDDKGSPQKVTVEQLREAQKALTNYENYERIHRTRIMK